MTMTRMLKRAGIIIKIRREEAEVRSVGIIVHNTKGAKVSFPEISRTTLRTILRARLWSELVV